MYEYEMKMKVYRLKDVDRNYDMHYQAWLNHQATATKKVGNDVVSAYKDFKDFFDYKKELKKIENPTKTIDPRMKRLARIAKRVNEGR